MSALAHQEDYETLVSDFEASQNVQDASFREKVDKLAELHMYLASYKQEYDRLKEEVSAIANLYPDRQDLLIRGNKYNLKFSASSQRSVIPPEMTTERVFEELGFAALEPTVKAIKAAEALRNRTYGYAPSILNLKWDSRKLLGAFHNV